MMAPNNARQTGGERAGDVLESAVRKYTGQAHYDIEVAGLSRRLPLVQVAPDLHIASFNMLGDTELVRVCAGALVGLLRGVEFDLLLAPEAKAIALAQSFCEQHDPKAPRRHIILRKSVKAFMRDAVSVPVNSITTKGSQQLVLDGCDAAFLKGKRVLMIDDVVSTGGTYRAMAELVNKVGAIPVAAAAVLREGNFDLSSITAQLGFEICCLAPLPVFRSND